MEEFSRQKVELLRRSTPKADVAARWREDQVIVFQHMSVLVNAMRDYHLALAKINGLYLRFEEPNVLQQLADRINNMR